MNPICRKALACLAALCLCAFGTAGAEGDSIGTYVQPEGVNVCEARDLVYFPAPDGLQPMYTMMGSASASSDVYVFIMPNGRALMSVSCTSVAQPGSAQTLMDAWTAIALRLSAEADQVDVDPSRAVMETQYGHDTLHVQTTMTFTGVVPLTIAADGVAFYNNGLLMELWCVQPQADPNGATDEGTAQALQEDLIALEALKSSFNFGQESIQSDAAFMASTVVYQDPDGAFSLNLPQNTVVITQATAAAAVKQERERYAAMSKGGDKVFDQLYQDVTEQNATLLLINEHGLACQLFCQNDPTFKNATKAAYYRLAEPVRVSLEERFGSAQLLSGDGQMTLSGLDHAWLAYWLRTEETDLVLNLFAITDANGYLREVDLFTLADQPAGEQEKVTRLIIESLSYAEPASAI